MYFILQILEVNVTCNGNPISQCVPFEKVLTKICHIFMLQLTFEILQLKKE